MILSIEWGAEMENNGLSLGQVVCSQAGRDKGRYMVIIEKIGTQYVKVADGSTRKVEKTKKKKIKHLAKTNHILSTVHKKLEKGQQVKNEEILKQLNQLGYTTQQLKKWEGS